jgi:hypothetical protein
MFKYFNFNDIGKKIKKIAEITFKVMTVLYLIAAVFFVIYAITDAWFEMLLPAIGCVLLGPALSWLSMVPLYGFGELIDKASETARNTRNGQNKSEAQSKLESERINKLEKLRSQGLITEEEYREAVSKEQ